MSIADYRLLPSERCRPPGTRLHLRSLLLHPASPVLLLTALGAVLRLSFLSRPPIWGDEAATFSRVCGTLQQTIDELRIVGFPPLHYMLYWWIAQHATLTPTVMRLVPALAGVLMVPAMYWLAVQLVGRRAALLAAAFTACSAYLLNYSRDAKMYSHFWLFATLNVACLLWWLRVRTAISYLAWLACGIAMLGLHAVGAALIAIEMLMVFTAPRPHWRSLPAAIAALPRFIYHAFLGTRRGRSGCAPAPLFRWPPLLLFVLGVGILSVVPAVYYLRFNHYVDSVQEGADDPRAWRRTGIGWVEQYNAGRSGPDLLRYTATAYLYGWEWPRSATAVRGRLPGNPLSMTEANEMQIPQRTRWLLKSAAVVLGGLLALGLLPWPRSSPPAAAPDPRQGAPFARWRSLLWLSAWLILPAWGFYCASMQGFDAHDVPGDRLLTLGRWFAQYWLPFTWTAGPLIIITMLAASGPWPDRLRSLLGALAIIVSLAALGLALNWIIRQPRPGSVWMPRYLGFVWPAFAIAVSWLLLRLPTRPVRWGAIALLLLVNLAQHASRLFADSEPPAQLIARDLLDSQPLDSPTRMYYRIFVPLMGAPGTGLLRSLPGAYYLAILSGKPAAPSQIRFGAYVSDNFRIWSAVMPLQNFVPVDLSRNPQVRRAIVWDKLDPGQIDLTDPILEKLGDQWQRTSEELFPARDHWTWRDLFTCRRRIYQRRLPATVPAAPATNPALP